MSQNTPAPVISAADVWSSLVRTIVPYIVGWVGAIFVKFNAPLDDATLSSLTGLLTVLFGTIYYILVRLVEQKYPAFGWLLGSAKQPTYVNSKTVQGEVVQNEVEVEPAMPTTPDATVAEIVNEVTDQARGN